MTTDKMNHSTPNEKRVHDKEKDAPFKTENRTPSKNQEFPVNPSNEPNDLSEGLIDPEDLPR